MTTPDLSAFDAIAQTSGPRSDCSVRLAIEELPPERSEALAAALSEKKYTHAVIARTLASWGLKVGQYTIARHRKGECHCG